MRRRVIIVGAGASGLAAAIQAARAGASVTLLEHGKQAGKKLLSTGNGRCNLTNLDQKEEYYRCSQDGFPAEVLKRFSVSETLAFFQGLGLETKSRNGYLYPSSGQASSVLEALLEEAKSLGVKLVCGCRVQKAIRKGEGFAVSSGREEFVGDALILAAGSRAAPATGSDGSGYELAAGFGHAIVTPLPALAPLRCGESHYRQLAGVRVEARLRLYGDGELLAEDTGELQLTDYGISGIPTFQISRYGAVALHRGQEVTVKIRFLPYMEEEELRALFVRRREKLGERTCSQWMNGLLNGKLSGVLLTLAGIEGDRRVDTVSQAQWNRLFGQVVSYETRVISLSPFESAQVCCGGVDTGQVRARTMESRLVKGLYFCGEILDVDGICGGYNLQWAWSSGAVAGRAAAAGNSGGQGAKRWKKGRKGKDGT